MPRLINHLLLRELAQRHDLSEQDQARACGYVGRGSSRVQLGLFKAAVAEAHKPISFNFVIRVWIESGSGSYLVGMKGDPQAGHSVIEGGEVPGQPDFGVVLSLFFRSNLRNNRSFSDLAFVVVSERAGDEETTRLVSDPKQPSTLAEDALWAAYCPDQHEFHFGPGLRKILVTPWALDHVDLLIRILTALIYSHEASHNPSWESLQIGRINPPVAITEFITSNSVANVIAGETPYYDSIAEVNNHGETVLPKPVLKAIQASKEVAIVSISRFFPAEGDSVVIRSWSEIEDGLDDYLRGDLQGQIIEDDRFRSEILLDIEIQRSGKDLGSRREEQ